MLQEQKGDIIGYSDDEQVDELPFTTKGTKGENTVYNHQSMDKWKVPTTKVKLLPATSLGLSAFEKCSHENIPIQRNEFVSILDEINRQSVIGPIKYRQKNIKLAQSFGSGFEESLVDAENLSNGENIVKMSF